jgi:hypothetical protein
MDGLALAWLAVAAISGVTLGTDGRLRPSTNAPSHLTLTGRP